MIKKFISRVAKSQKGFTLIEMIVVVGIIAVLAAVIIPNIGRFIGTGESGAKTAEAEAVQTAMNAMMAENSITTVDANTTAAAAVQNWAALPTGTGTCPLGDNAVVGCNPNGYLQSPSTIYFYCWGANGQLDVDAAGEVVVLTAAGACP